MIRNFFKCVGLSFFSICLFNNDLLRDYFSSNMTDKSIIDSIFFVEDIGEIKIGMFFLSMIRPMVFAFYYGMFFYNNVTLSGIYGFIRYCSRRKWYFEKVIHVSFFALSFSIVSSFFLYFFTYGFLFIFDIHILKVFCLYTYLSFVYCMKGVLICNMLIICLGSALGYAMFIIFLSIEVIISFMVKAVESTVCSLMSSWDIYRLFYAELSFKECLFDSCTVGIILLLFYYLIKKCDMGLINKDA